MTRLAQSHAAPVEAAHGISVGDVVRAGDNLYPHYRVIAIAGDRAWVRDVQQGSDHVVPLARTHKVQDSEGRNVHAVES